MLRLLPGDCCESIDKHWQELHNHSRLFVFLCGRCIKVLLWLWCPQTKQEREDNWLLWRTYWVPRPTERRTGHSDPEQHLLWLYVTPATHEILYLLPWHALACIGIHWHVWLSIQAPSINPFVRPAVRPSIYPSSVHLWISSGGLLHSLFICLIVSLPFLSFSSGRFASPGVSFPSIHWLTNGLYARLPSCLAAYLSTYPTSCYQACPISTLLTLSLYT